MSILNKTVNKGEEKPIKQRGSPRNKLTQSITFLSDHIPDACSMTISEKISNSNPEAIPERTKANC